MKIIKQGLNYKPFDLVMPGSCFEYKGNYYLAIDDPFMAVNLDTGYQARFMKTEMVNEVDAHVVIDNAEG